MSPDELAHALELKSKDFLDFLSGIPEAEWAKTTDAEGWPLAVTAHHLAVGAQFVMDLAQHVADGGEIGWTQEFIDEANATHAAVFADISPEEAVSNLRERMGEAVERIRSMTKEQLLRPVDEPWPYSGTHLHHALDIIDHMIIRHIDGHTSSIRAATE